MLARSLDSETEIPIWCPLFALPALLVLNVKILLENSAVSHTE